MNGTGNEASIRAKAVPRYWLIDKEGRVCERIFLSKMEAATYAQRAYPDQEQDEDRTGKGWDIEVVR